MKTLFLILVLAFTISAQTADERNAYSRAFNEKNLAEKIKFVNNSPHRAAIWRIHFRVQIAKRKLSPEQQEIVWLAYVAIVARDTEAIDELLPEIERLLPNDKDIFTNIGGWVTVGRYCTKKLEFSGLGVLPFYSDCTCSVGSGFNMACADTCSGGGGCTAVDGCGFAWLYRCNGGCTPKHAPHEDPETL